MSAKTVIARRIDRAAKRAEQRAKSPAEARRKKLRQAMWHERLKRKSAG